MVEKAQIVSKDKLQEGFSFSIDNAIELLSSAMDIQEKHQSKALALAQIGQEEIGKSLTILASFSLPEEPEAWKWFWKGWRDHKLKAHRAYLYELVTPLRLSISSTDGQTHDGGPLRNPITREKEIGLYVDYDSSEGSFVLPKHKISSFDCLARISTLMYLSATADAVNRALSHEDSDFRFKSFGHMAFKFCTEEIYQQQMPAVYDRISSMSEQHSRMIADLHVALEAPKKMFQELAL